MGCIWLYYIGVQTWRFSILFATFDERLACSPKFGQKDHAPCLFCKGELKVHWCWDLNLFGCFFQGFIFFELHLTDVMVTILATCLSVLRGATGSTSSDFQQDFPHSSDLDYLPVARRFLVISGDTLKGLWLETTEVPIVLVRQSDHLQPVSQADPGVFCKVMDVPSLGVAKKSGKLKGRP